ncbi:peptidase inhibitor 16-like [Argopecten irradians]|uniref:peptidase inhibitor 16-like n=1 Tax=Argopecten irradians TaxID=31199 RepID=UPI003711F454
MAVGSPTKTSPLEELQLETEVFVDTRSTEKNGLSQDEKDELLNYHNEARRNVNPSASNMLAMEWDNELTATAQGYANQCSWGHNRNLPPNVGETLTYTSHYNGKNVVNSWVAEKNAYDYTTNKCSSYTCANYRRVVWATTALMGCGAKWCEAFRAVVVVCNYKPSENFADLRPYKKGESCSDCSSGRTCVNKLFSKQ